MNRIFVEKKKGFDVRRELLEREIFERLGLEVRLRMLLGYKMEGKREHFLLAKDVVFSSPQSDVVYLDELPNLGGHVFVVALNEGQYDQRADSCEQCIQMLTSVKPKVSTFTVYAFEGVNEEQLKRIKEYLINPIEMREILLDFSDDEENLPLNLQPEKRVEGFIDKNERELREFYLEFGFSFTFEDMIFIRDYFYSLNRNPYEVELKVLDAYWSDHCRHTTFNTTISELKSNSMIPHIKSSIQNYENLMKKLSPNKQSSLMNMATIGAKELKSSGILTMLDESEEINACSIKVRAMVDGEFEDWIVMFKNETHNHPTEIEPFGGSATCLGGAIRDPLSGRTYVYQAMRVSGAGNINTPIEQTVHGKLPQCVIARGSAHGFSSYGNQIGLATGLVKEFYHAGYTAKRLEAGFVVAGAKAENIVRKSPQKGDIIMLIGGGTGRDGCGGATGSSKSHSQESLMTCGAEVQKGNPVTERKLQRLFRNAEFAKMVKRCNDFGAGGVSVAVGELADGVDIDLNAVFKKYLGLSGLELAISESQERMAVVISPQNEQKVREFCLSENLESAVIAQVTDLNKMRMFFNGEAIVDLDRDFLNTNGVMQQQKVLITDHIPTFFNESEQHIGNFEQFLAEKLSNPLIAGQKGLVEMFDSTIGASTLLMPFGGKHQTTPAIAMASKLPVDGVTDTATVCAYGFNPHLSEQSPYVASMYAVATSVIKTTIAGADYNTIYLTFQEFFEKLHEKSEKWGKCASALLGAMEAQLKLKKASIGGKDSMSGSYMAQNSSMSINVPPTLVSFALGIAKSSDIIHNVLTKNLNIYRYSLPRDGFGVPDLDALNRFLTAFNKQKGRVKFATIVEEEGAVCALIKSAFGNRCGINFKKFEAKDCAPLLGDILFGLEQTSFVGQMVTSESMIEKECELFATSDGSGIVRFCDNLAKIDKLEQAYYSTYKHVYPHEAEGAKEPILPVNFYTNGSIITRKSRVAKPRVFIPIFPGTNCEYDTARAFRQAGADVETFVIKNKTSEDIEQSMPELVRRIEQSNIFCLAGGFSGGDEPDGSGKFICSTLINPYVSEAIERLIYVRDGLILGICNGFQALIKLGLLPYGKIGNIDGDSPTLTFNKISRHVSGISRVRVASNLSPWFSEIKTGEVFNQAISHGEGRFIANPIHLERMIKGNQIATQYVDLDDKPTGKFPFNPNGSINAIEGICSEDGRILGKMGHAERIGKHLYRNIEGNFDMKIFTSGVKYFD